MTRTVSVEKCRDFEKFGHFNKKLLFWKIQDMEEDLLVGLRDSKEQMESLAKIKLHFLSI